MVLAAVPQTLYSGLAADLYAVMAIVLPWKTQESQVPWKQRSQQVPTARWVPKICYWKNVCGGVPAACCSKASTQARWWKGKFALCQMLASGVESWGKGGRLWEGSVILGYTSLFIGGEFWRQDSAVSDQQPTFPAAGGRWPCVLQRIMGSPHLGSPCSCSFSQFPVSGVTRGFREQVLETPGTGSWTHHLLFEWPKAKWVSWLKYLNFSSLCNYNNISLIGEIQGIWDSKINARQMKRSHTACSINRSGGFGFVKLEGKLRHAESLFILAAGSGRNSCCFYLGYFRFLVGATPAESLSHQLPVSWVCLFQCVFSVL